MNLKTYKLSELLDQYRETHFVENEHDYKQLTISKYNGVSYRGTKNGKHIGRKRQFIVNLRKYPHTLLFTRQGVKDGSIGIAPKDVDGCIATENMPMFSINTSIVLPELLASWLNSEECKMQIDSITPTGSAQKAIHERDLLKILVSIPENIEDQKKLINVLNIQKKTIDFLNSENQSQFSYLTKLRQAILQEAIEGKLTADWRKENPVRKGDPDYDAEALLEKIQAEKEKLIKEGNIKKQKPLAPIKLEEVPFDLPEGWVWTRLGEICDFITKGTTPSAHELLPDGEIPYLKVYNIVDQKINFFYRPQYINHEVHNRLSRSKVYPDDVLMNIVGPPLGKVALIPNTFPEWNINQALAIFRCLVKVVNKYIYYYLLEGSCITSIQVLGVVGQDNISLEQSRDIIIALPPITEQYAIINHVEKFLAMIDELEKQVSEREEQSEQLMQAVLREAFEGGK